VNANSRAVAGALSRQDLITLALNSFLGSFLPPEAVAGRLAAIDAYVASAAARGYKTP
jgi:adenosine deaminase